VKLDRIETSISLSGSLPDEQRARFLEIAQKCPVHRTLASEVRIQTRLADKVATSGSA
jgi:putative redox protein